MLDEIIVGNEININISERCLENRIVGDMDTVPSGEGVNIKKEIDTTFNMELNRTKPEPVTTGNYDKCNLMTGVVEHIKKEDGEIGVKIEETDLEAYVDKEKPYGVMDSIQLTEELDIKVDSDASTEKTPYPVSIRAVEKERREIAHRKTASKLFSCYNCEYATYCKDGLIEHMKLHSKHVECTCANCEETLKKIASTETRIIADQGHSQQLYRCRNCAYETTVKIEITKHFLEKHTDTSTVQKPSSCSHCDAIYKTRAELYDHIIKKHPSFTGSIPRKIHQCTYCTFKTTRSSVFTKHVLIHLGSAPTPKHKTCPHCNRIYKRKRSLDNHIVIRHPDFIASVTSKIYECTKCTYKTTVKNDLARHAPIHEKAPRASEFRFFCSYCNKKYKTTKSRDNHIVREHPDFIASVTISKVHECKYCKYKSIFKKNVSSHKCKAPKRKLKNISKSNYWMH